jgi:hypothetical protein
VCADRLPDAAPPAVLGPQLEGLEPPDVLRVEEHEPDDGLPLVHSVRVPVKQSKSGQQSLRYIVKGSNGLSGSQA